MRHSIFLLTVATFIFISCKKSPETSEIPPGTYKGTFERSNNPTVSNVTLVLSANKFEGQSELLHYPDICNGNFSTNKDSVSFENSCVYTADFDWSYILENKFKFSVPGDSLILTREYNVGPINSYDVYKLKKQ